MKRPVVPALREELALYPAPVQQDGSPCWSLHDPARNSFFSIDWLTFEILRHWACGDPAEIAQAVRDSTTLGPSEEDVAAVVAFLTENQLLQPGAGYSAPHFAQRLKARRGTWSTRLIHHYLFFRIPLWRPDAWLQRHLGHVALFGSTGFLRLTLAAFALGGFQLLREWERYSTTLVDTITWDGLLAYGVALMALKVLHEFGHAFAAKMQGCRVPTMGVAFLVLWPMAYTDTTEAWKLADRRKRFGVAAAGLKVEFMVAAWALLAWGFLPEGTPRAIAFVLSTTALAATLAINASPFMRFDGYFLLCDLVNLPNLHARAFALARWHLREKLFRLGEPVPEVFPRRKTGALILFAWVTWAYRLTLFLSIAALVYHFFIKAVGIVLFAIEIGWFVGLPIWRELAEWQRRWPALRANPHARRSAAIIAALIMLLVLPWPSRLATSGILRPVQFFPIHAPAHAQVLALPAGEGGWVEQGAVIVRLASPEMEARHRAVAARVERLQWQADVAGVDAEQRARQPVLYREFESARAELAQIAQETELYAPRAPFSGYLRDLDPDLRPGVWTREREKLALLVGDGGWQVETYLDEAAVNRIEVGDHGRFYADTPAGEVLPLTVASIDRDASRQLPDGMLVTYTGGSLLAREAHGFWVPELAVYRVVLNVDGRVDGLDDHSWRGRAVIVGRWEAPGWRFLRAAASVFWREMGF